MKNTSFINATLLAASLSLIGVISFPKTSIAQTNCPVPYTINQVCSERIRIEVSAGPDEENRQTTTEYIEFRDDGWELIPGSIRTENIRENESPSEISWSIVADGNRSVTSRNVGDSFNRIREAAGNVRGEHTAVSQGGVTTGTAEIEGQARDEFERWSNLVRTVDTSNSRIEVTATTQRRCNPDFPTFAGNCADYVGRYAGWYVDADFVYVGTEQDLANRTNFYLAELEEIEAAPPSPSLSLVLDANRGGQNVYLYSTASLNNGNHLWDIVPVTDGYHMLVSQNGFALDANGATESNPPYSNPNPDRNNPNHLWRLEDVGGYRMITSRVNGSALDANGGSQNLYFHPNPDRNNPNHLWKFVDVDGLTIIGSGLQN